MVHALRDILAYFEVIETTDTVEQMTLNEENVQTLYTMDFESLDLLF